MRLDVFLFEKRGQRSRTLAARLIKAGAVTLHGKVITKSDKQISPADESFVEIQENKITRFVSRAGLKLEGAIAHFVQMDTCFDPKNKICLDIGSSTGGFTQCLLQAGAKQVFAVDVGSGQLDAELRENAKVHVYEQTDIRDFAENKLYQGAIGEDEYIEYIVCDVSFISLSKIIPVITHIAKNAGQSTAGISARTDKNTDVPTGTNINTPTDTKPKREIYCILLIKPQFEVGQVNLNKQGIVTSPEATEASIQKIKTL